MRFRGRPVLGAVCGLLFGIFLALDLVFFKVVTSASILLLALPIAGLVLGIAGGLGAPLGRGRIAVPAPVPQPPPAPVPPAPDPVEPA